MSIIVNNLKVFEEKANELIKGFKIKVSKYDYSRVNLSILENIKINYFGTLSSIKYMVNIKRGDKGEYFLTPFDKSQLEEIYKAIINYKTNWIIVLQKNWIRLHAPLPTTEAKKKTQKIINDESEQIRIKFRQYRHKLLDVYKKEEKDKDDLLSLKNELDKTMSKFEEKLKKNLNEIIVSLFKV